MALNGLPAVNCARPSRWGNPHRIGPSLTREGAIARFERDVASWSDFVKADLKADLRGKNLACYCALSDACHCDILLREANR